MQYNKIGQFEYNDSKNAYIPLLSYIIYEDKNKERFALLKFINKSGIRVNSFKIKIHQFDDEKEIQEDEILFDNLDVATHDAFVPFTKVMLNPNMKTFKVEALLINSMDAKISFEVKEDESIDNSTQVRKIKKRNKYLARGVHASLLGLGILLVVGVGVYFGISSINNFKANITEYEVDGITISNNGVITNYSGSSKNLIIPSKLANVDVKKIGSSAFKNANIESLSIKASAYTISNDAFDSCTSLKSINLGDVKEIGENAFLNCKNLTNVLISSSPTLDSYCFANTGLKIFSNENELVVSKYAFDGCTLEEFNCPNATISAYALGNPSNLKTLIYGTSSENAINNLFSLASEPAIENITTACSYFSDSYFEDLPNLKNVTFKSSGFYITDNCVDSLKGLNSYKEENGLELIGDCALKLSTSSSEYILKTGFSNYSSNVANALTTISDLTINLKSETFPVDVLSGKFNTIRVEENTKITRASSLTSKAQIENLYLPAYNETLKNYFNSSIEVNNLYITGSGNIISGYLDGISVKNVTISDNISSIGTRFVDNNTILESVTISQNSKLNGTVIGSNCPKLVKVEMPLYNNYSYYNESYKNTKELKIVGTPQSNALSDKDDYNIIKLSLNTTNIDLSNLSKLSILNLSGISGKTLSKLGFNLSKLKTLILDSVLANGFIDTSLSGINIMLINGASMSRSDVSNLNSINLYVDNISSSKAFLGYDYSTVNTLVYEKTKPSINSIYTYGSIDYKTYKYTISYGSNQYEYQSVFLDAPLMIIDGDTKKSYQFSPSGFSKNNYIYINETIKYTYNIYKTETRTITYKVNNETYYQTLVNGTNTLKASDIQGFVGWYTDSYYTSPVTDGKLITSDIVLYGKVISNLINIGATKIESSGTYYINGKELNGFNLKVYGSGRYYLYDEKNNGQALNDDSYGIASEASVSGSSLYSIKLNAGDIIILEGNKLTANTSVLTDLKEEFITSVEKTSYPYNDYIDVSKVTNDSFIGLFTESGEQLTDSSGKVINYIVPDENNILKLYARYN